MTLPFARKPPAKNGFRWKLMLALMGVIAAVTAAASYLAEHNLAAEVSASLGREFNEKLASLNSLQEVRYAVLSERSRALVRKPRIHAALEDNALDLLYPSAQDELRDVLAPPAAPSNRVAQVLHAEFYRFLDSAGAVLSPADGRAFGELAEAEERQLALPGIPRGQQFGCLPRLIKDRPEPAEVIAVPIFSTETGDPISALVLGFKPLELGATRTGLQTGVFTDGALHFPALDAAGRDLLQRKLNQELSLSNRLASFRLDLPRAPQLVFYKHLNPGSAYPAAYEICIFPLNDLFARRDRLRWQIFGAGSLMLLGGLAFSIFLSGRLSEPVEQLAVDRERHRTGRERAEAALEQTSVELQRSIRFSADASHQLKTPVTVMRAGLEELLAREDISLELRREIDHLVHQTFRLSGVVDDLLLLSRMDAGRLRLDLGTVDLSLLLDGELDDLGAQPNPLGLSIEFAVPRNVRVQGECRYTNLILRNLLENARKYNRLHGWIRVSAKLDASGIELSVANSGPEIPPAMQVSVFERFHRGAAAENVPGHGLGLNLARELARLHGGDLWLARSNAGSTEFVVRFRLAEAAVAV